MAPNRDILAALDRLAKAEDAFLRQQFLAPVVKGAGVAVRIAGVICRLKVEPNDFDGFGVFRPASHVRAALVREASLTEQRRYLELFPVVRLVVCRRDARDNVIAVPLNEADGRFSDRQPVQLHLSDEAELFETVRARFDGGRFWFDELDERVEPGVAGELRQWVAQMRPPARADRPGLLPGHRVAYAIQHRARLEAIEADARASGERRLREALTHAGARLRDFAERRDVFRVDFEFDGRRHTTVVRKTDLTVQTAGICLSGQDRNFDLNSLVGVLREARGGR